ncbi:5-hydroxytryptamine receptor 2A-like [Oppia nitens]|uniref:5-hydroxytryptamine receptor 2A-like n=1 Tax=Oppia nitens TaxID=1686743 RepID=UPI0023DA4A74|nr:5-hydroxytryptamine receptor 2A-like [Oppia nitens]
MAMTIVMASILALAILCTVIGNLFVIAAILLERHLRAVGNYLVFSLAVADLMVACLVMPLGAVYVVSGQWSLGPDLCDVWTIVDVLCCTASILHLLAIAMDRFWAVTNVDYIHNRNSRRIGTMIFIIWAVAMVVSLAPVLGWKDPDFLKRIEVDRICLLSQDIAYQMFATCSTFYVPLALILILYWRIFQVARKRIRRKPGNKVVLALRKASGSTRSLTVPSTTTVNEMTTNFSSEVSTSATASGTSDKIDSMLLPNHNNKKQQQRPHHQQQRESIEAKRERKAAKTLAIITGLFVICWLPFFIVALLMPLCESCRENIPLLVLNIFQWLGYINSGINPIIYTIFSPDFRTAFKKMLLGKRAINISNINNTKAKSPVRV